MKASSLELLERSSLPTLQARAILQAMEAELAERDDALATKRDLQDGLRDVRTGLREEFRAGFHELEIKIESVRGELIRWNFAFWIAQLAAVAGLLKLMR